MIATYQLLYHPRTELPTTIPCNLSYLSRVQYTTYGLVRRRFGIKNNFWKMVVFLSVYWASLPYIGWLSLPSPLPCQTIKSAIDHLHLHLEDWLPADLCPPEDILWSKKLLVRFLFTGTALTTSPVSILRPNRGSLCHPWLKTLGATNSSR